MYWNIPLTTVALLGLAVTSQAEVLSSNLSAQPFYTDVVDGNTWIAAGFGTGASSYELTTATLILAQDSAGTPQLDLYSSTDGQPGTLLGALAGPDSFSSTPSLTQFTAANLLLASNSSYWLVLKAGSGSYEWAYTEDNTGSGAGFQGVWGESDDAGATWFSSDIEPMILGVNADPTGAAVPESQSSALVLAGGMLLTLSLLLKKRRDAGEIL
jgi:hypothetical protein